MQASSHHGSLGASVDYHYWATGIPSTQRVLPTANRNPKPLQLWSPLPQSWYDDYFIGGETIEHSYRAQDNWHFKDVGQGVFTFEAVNTGGNLVIGLTGWNHSDLHGYYIVLDDDNHESYVLKLAKIGNDGLLRDRVGGGRVDGRRGYVRVPGVKVDPSFRLNFSENQKFWVLYQRGTIIVGHGGAPGVGKQILYMAPEENKQRDLGTDLYHYGFGRLGSRWRGKTNIRNTQVYAYTQAPLFPLPNIQLSAPASDGNANKTNANGVEVGRAFGGPLYSPNVIV